MAENFVKSQCHNCRNSIEFDANLLDQGETRTIKCPHCRLDVILIAPPREVKHWALTEEARMMSCPDCNKTVSRNASSCPHCGRVLKSIFWKTFKVIVSIIVILALIYFVFGLILTALVFTHARQ